MTQEMFFDFSNYVTYARIILIFVVVYLLFLGNTYLYLVAIVLIILAVFMDYIDGVVARKCIFLFFKGIITDPIKKGSK